MAKAKPHVTHEPRTVKRIAVRKSEQPARLREEQYRSLFDLNPCPMWICDESTLKFLDVNKAALRLYGWSRRSFMRMTARDIRPAKDVAKFLRVVTHQRSSGTTLGGEWRHVKRDGTVFDVSVTIGSILYAGRQAQVVLVNDITERKRVEYELNRFNVTLEQRVAERTEELTNTNERLHAIMETALVGILTLDERGVVESLNPAAVQIFGYEPQEIVGRNISRLMASPDQAQRDDFLAHYQQTHGRDYTSTGREVLGQRKDGHAIMLELAVRELAQGGRRQFVAMVRNITGRKRLERELLEVGEGERQRIGRDLHDSLGQHLHAMYYMAALLQRELKAEASPHAREAGRLSKLLSKALDLSRSLAHGLQPVNPVPEGLMMTLRELARRTRSLYRMDCQFDCDTPVLIHRHSAATHLYRIAQEAVNNAMKHGKSSRIRIQLTGTPQQITLVIRDNGVGIRRRTKSAEGMGLHIMQYRADAIGGSLLLRRHRLGGTEVVCNVSRKALLSGADEVK
jgi:PAS domain S-box-containing protein